MRTWVAMALTALALAGCEGVTSEKIALWKGTEKGPGKIVDALRNPHVAADLRARAVMALAEIGMPEKADEILAAMPNGERLAIVEALVPAESAVLAGDSIPRIRDARDGLFSVRQYAPSELRRVIDTALLASWEKDLRNGRFAGGRHSVEKMLTAIGPSAGPMLVQLLAAPDAPFRGLTELLVKVGSDADRAQAGAALARRAEAASEVPNDLWIAMGITGGPAVTDFLSRKLLKGSAADAAAAARALQQSRYPAMLATALKIAGDDKADRLLRDEIFGVIERIGGPEAQNGLIAIIANDKNEMVRYRAFESALEVGKAEAVLPALEAFPAKLSYRREDVLDFLVKDITKLGQSAHSTVQKALGSPSVLARMAAVLALEPTGAKAPLGSAADAPLLLAIGNDRAAPKGFPADRTIGAEAKRVAAMLQK